MSSEFYTIVVPGLAKQLSAICVNMAELRSRNIEPSFNSNGVFSMTGQKNWHSKTGVKKFHVIKISGEKLIDSQGTSIFANWNPIEQIVTETNYSRAKYYFVRFGSVNMQCMYITDMSYEPRKLFDLLEELEQP